MGLAHNDRLNCRLPVQSGSASIQFRIMSFGDIVMRRLILAIAFAVVGSVQTSAAPLPVFEPPALQPASIVKVSTPGQRAYARAVCRAKWGNRYRGASVSRRGQITCSYSKTRTQLQREIRRSCARQGYRYAGVTRRTYQRTYFRCY
jgi:hypothetical protein